MKFSGILICSDVDGTLAMGGVVPSEHIKAIEYFQNNGGLFTFATGRSHLYLNDFLSQIKPNTDIIVYNGTAIYDMAAEKMLWEKFLDNSITDFFEKLMHKFPHHQTVFLHAKDVSYELDPSTEDCVKAIQSLDRPLYKVVLKQSEEETDAMYREYCGLRQYEIYKSCPTLFEITAKGAGKGVAINKLRQILKDDVKTIVGIGDYQNDIPLLQESDIGVAVTGPYTEILQHADWIAPKYSEFPIRWLIEEIERKLI